MWDMKGFMIKSSEQLNCLSASYALVKQGEVYDKRMGF